MMRQRWGSPSAGLDSGIIAGCCGPTSHAGGCGRTIAGLWMPPALWTVPIIFTCVYCGNAGQPGCKPLFGVNCRPNQGAAWEASGACSSGYHRIRIRILVQGIVGRRCATAQQHRQLYDVVLDGGGSCTRRPWQQGRAGSIMPSDSSGRSSAPGLAALAGQRPSLGFLCLCLCPRPPVEGERQCPLGGIGRGIVVVAVIGQGLATCVWILLGMP
mmetsp:Transcript_129083/g.223081  ORF Transcript_129083/g.223081 Transcript_129083/m.223081 type:complete len:214 (+) Transcript_129083:232-873(+)